MNIDGLKEHINKLNDEQKQAATYDKGSTIVLAAAGSGKTSTLTSRIAYLIAIKNIPAHNILAVTFTNKAAKEMQARLLKMGINIQNLWIGTFHGICNKILRYHAKEAGLNKSFTIMDSQEQLTFLKRVLRANEYDPKVINVSDLQNKINGYKEEGWRPSQLRIGSQERKFYEMYEEACHRDNCVDFGELMLGCYELFEKYPEISESYSNKFQHILVDEFQDTSELQYKWLKKLALKHKNLFAVGDDDQCFPKGTIIKTPSGNKNIENIKIGDFVISLLNKKKVQGQVINKYEKIVNKKFITITLENDTKVTSTNEHIYFTYRKNHSYDKNLYTHECIMFDGRPKEIHKLIDLKNNSDLYTIFSSNIKDFEEFNIYGFDDRNDSEIQENPLTKKQKNIIYFKALINKKECLCLKGNELMIGDKLYTHDFGFLNITNIEYSEKKELVYDLDIKKLHNYFANDVLVHNSIYGFRGAKPENLNLLKEDFNAQMIKIEKNYRSDGFILEAANSVIKHNTNRQGKNLVPTKPSKQRLSLYNSFNDEQEAMFIAQEMKKLRRLQIPFKQMAILYRTNGQSRSLEKALNANAIPYIVYGGFRFFDRQEVKHAMAYLRLAYNPNDNLAFIRVANIPARAVGETAIRKLEVLANENKCSLYEMACQLDTKTQKKYLPFIEVIDKLKSYCAGKSIPEMTKIVIEHSGLEEMYQKDQKEGEERLDNLYELLSAAEVFTAENKNADIDEFLAFSTLESNVETKKRDENADAVKLMTVHSSKGLEFEVVFLSGLEESLFPHANSLDNPSAIEEERRLMYVAITRARTALYISYSEERLLHGQRTRLLKSRFLKEIPAHLLQSIN